MFHCKIALYGGLGGDEVAPLEALFARVVEPVGVVGAAAPAQRRLVGFAVTLWSNTGVLPL